MDCVKFQDSISDYLDGALDSRQKAECAAHRLTCRDCRELYTDVRATVQALSSPAARAVDEPEGLAKRIIAATTAGEMLSCGDFDRIIERYFDGVVLAPTFQTFQAHFDKCTKCRRLMVGIEETIAMCREIKETEVDAPDSLNDRIIAATVGQLHDHDDEARPSPFAAAISLLISWFHVLWTPQMAVAALIFAASSLLILSRFGSVSGMASQGKAQAALIVDQGQRAINETGALARTGFLRFSSEVNTLLDGRDGKRQQSPKKSQQLQSAQPAKSQPAHYPSPQPSPGSPQ